MFDRRRLLILDRLKHEERAEAHCDDPYRVHLRQVSRVIRKYRNATSFARSETFVFGTLLAIVELLTLGDHVADKATESGGDEDVRLVHGSH